MSDLTTRRSFVKNAGSVGLGLFAARLSEGADCRAGVAGGVAGNEGRMQTGLVSDARYLQHRQSSLNSTALQ